MMQTLRRYRALTGSDRQLVTEAAMFLGAARLGIALLPFPVMRNLLDRFTDKRGRSGFSRDRDENSSRPRMPIERVSWAVTAVSRRVPFQTTCLVDSLAVDAMLRRRGYHSQIRFGVRMPDGARLAAHSWVEHDGKIVFGATGDSGDYSVLSATSISREAHDAS
jgi:transglutaminase superfamily protein